jgi:adenine-specific DNA-methyltransferase
MPHPAQFPVAIIDRIVRASSQPGAIVLDPFMGSGTVAEVALSTGRRAIGFETEPRYIDVIDQRLAAYVDWKKNVEAQSGLFEIEKSEEFAPLNAG